MVSLYCISGTRNGIRPLILKVFRFILLFEFYWILEFELLAQPNLQGLDSRDSKDTRDSNEDNPKS